MLESKYQKKLMDQLEKSVLPGCIVLKNDANLRPGIPDLTIFYGGRWATLEVKTGPNAEVQPNQPWYVETMNAMSFSRFIFPEVEREVLTDLYHFFHS